MKKTKVFVLIMVLMAMFVSGCSGFSYVFSGSPGKYKIEVNAPDNKYAESSDFSVGKDRNTVVSADLSEGELQIEFAEATVILGDPDTPEDVIIGQVVETVTISGKDEKTLQLPEGDYVMLVTSKGKTKGVVNVNIVKP